MKKMESCHENVLNVKQPSETLYNNINCNSGYETSSNNTESVEKSSAVWTYKSTLILLKLYENKLQMLETPKKKTRIWIAISESLKDYKIKMSPNQVRWKINALTKKYRQCLDIGQTLRFKYFKELDNIYAKYSVDCANLMSGDFLHKKKKTGHVDNSKSSIPLQMHESKAMIEIRKVRLANRMESERLQSKLNLERQWFDYLKREEQNRQLQDEIVDGNLKIKEDQLEIQRYGLEIMESLQLRKMQLKERELEELIRNEREKCEILNQILENKNA